MASSEQIQEILEMLTVAYPNANINPRTPDIYESILGGCDGVLLRQAAVEHIQHSKWFPSVAELFEGVQLLSQNRPTPPKVPSFRIYELEDLAVRGQFDAGSWEEFAVELDNTGRATMAQAVRRRINQYAAI